MTDPIVIIGTGLAGYTLAREIRKRDKQVPLCLITRDDGAFYSKPMLSNALAKQKTPDELATAAVAKMRDELNAEILAKTTVKSVNAASKTVELDTGKAMRYRQLVLAVGAKPVAVHPQGDAAAHICVVNNLDDYRGFRQRIHGKHSVAVIGPGLIGCEFANDLISAGYEVHVIGPDPWPLGRLLPPRAGAAVQQALQAIGVQWHLQRNVQAVNAHADQFHVALDNQQVLTVDVVLSAIGSRANTELAQAAGLQLNRGIVVDRLLQTSCADIFALGDCAEVEGMLLPFVMPLMQQARALAASLCGEPTPVTYPAMPVLVKTTSYPVVVSPPPLQAQGAWEEEVSSGGVKALFKADDKLLGFALTGTAVTDKQALTKLLPAMLA